MNPAIYLLMFLPIIIVLMQGRETRQQAAVCRIMKKHREGRKLLTGFIDKFIGKDCLIYTMNSQVDGTVKAVDGGWVEIEKNGETQILNAEYIVRIREYPRGKNGKKKSIVGD